MLNFPDAPVADQVFDATAKASFIWKLGPDRWRRQPPVPVTPEAIQLVPNHDLVNKAIPVSVIGQGFTAGCKVYVAGVTGELPTTFFSATELRFTMPANATPQTVQVWVVMDGTTTLPPTAGLNFTYDPIPIVLSSLNPASFVQAAGVQTGVMQLMGSGFNANCFAMINGMLSPLTYVSPTQMTSNNIDLRTLGTFPILVKDTQTQVESNALNFVVGTTLSPTVTAVNPSSVVQGTTVATLTVTGMNFVNGKRVKINNVALATTYVNATTLTVANWVAPFSIPSVPVTVEDAIGSVNINLTGAPGSSQLGYIVPDIWPHYHQDAPYYGRCVLVLEGGAPVYDTDEVLINGVVFDSWPENGGLMFTPNYMGGDPAIVQRLPVTLRRGGVPSSNYEVIFIGGS